MSRSNRSHRRSLIRRPLIRRSVVPGVLAAALLVPALAGCEAGGGANNHTFHPPAAGAYATSHGLTLSNVFVLGPALHQTLAKGQNAGLFVSISGLSPDTLESVSAPGTASSVQIQGGTVTLSAGGVANLTGPSPRLVLTGLSKQLRAGQNITVVFQFQKAGEIKLQVPVKPYAFNYTTFSPPAAAAAAAATGSPAAS